MFQQGNYDQISLPIPSKGMNKFISPDFLKEDFAVYLENIIPSPAGIGQVRYGTNKINNLENPSSSIIEAFPYVKQDGSFQYVLYVQEYQLDNTVDNPVVLDQINLSFNSENTQRYIIDTYLKIEYSLNDANYTLYPKISSIGIIDDLVDITIGNSSFPAGDVVIISISYPVGRIYSYDYKENQFSGILRDGLSVDCIPRGIIFNQLLLICNGVDRILEYNGDTVIDVYDFVKEVYVQNQAFTRNTANQLQFTSFGIFSIEKYAPGNLIKLNVNRASYVLTIAASQEIDNTVTIDTVGALPAFGEGDDVELFYRDWPLPFNYLYAGPDRVWALGPGPAGIGFREPDYAMKVYFTYLSDSVLHWFNENTKGITNIDISNTHGIQDNLEAICQINGLTALMGRSRTQVWTGSTPPGLPNANASDLSWSTNLDVGIAHGNLLINMPNDIYFISQTGLKSFGTLNVAKQFAATSLNAVDPLISEFLSSIMKSDDVYRSCRSFKYKEGRFCGFKFGTNNILVSLFETGPYAWTLFSGDFQRSSTFLDTGDSLALFIGNAIYQYADGGNGLNVKYGDNDGNSIISFSWIPGLVNKGTRGFANRRFQLILSYPSVFTSNKLNKIYIKVNGDMPNTFRKEEEIQLDTKGDVFGGPPLAGSQDQSEQPGYFKLGKDYSILIKRFKFESSRFWMTLYGYVLDGPIYFRELKFFGVRERNG